MEWRTFDEVEPDPMLPEQFEIAVKATQIRKPELIAASRAVLVEGAQATDIAKELGIGDVSHVYRAVKSIQQKWKNICATERWEYFSLAVPESVADEVMALQRKLLKNYSEKQGKGGRRRKK